MCKKNSKMVINTNMNKKNFISIRTTKEYKQELISEEKNANTTISKLILDTINKAKDKTTKNLQRV